MKRQPLIHLLQNRPMFLALAFILMTVFPVLAGSDTYTELLTHTPVFAKPLTWVGGHPPSVAESKELWEITGEGHNKFSETTAGFEEFIKKHPESPWDPSLESHLAEYYYQSGYFTPALRGILDGKKVVVGTEVASAPAQIRASGFTALGFHLELWRRMLPRPRMTDFGRWQPLVTCLAIRFQVNRRFWLRRCRERYYT
jgi:hypothetical protein